MFGVEYGCKFELEGPAPISDTNQAEKAGFFPGAAAHFESPFGIEAWELNASSFAESSKSSPEVSYKGSDGKFVGYVIVKKDANTVERTFTLRLMLPEGEVIPEHRYKFSAALNIIQEFGTGINLKINWYNGENFETSSLLPEGPQLGTGPKILSVNGIAHKNATKAQLVLYGTSKTANDAGAIMIDNVVFKETGERIVFNDSTDPDFVGMLNPESSGLDSADVREDAQDSAGVDGGVHGDFLYGRRPVIFQGTVLATSKADRSTKTAKIKAATNAMRKDATLTWQPEGIEDAVRLLLRRQQPVRFTKAFVKDFFLPMVSAQAEILSIVVDEVSNGSQNSASLVAGSGEDKGGPEPWTNPSRIVSSNNSYAENPLTSEMSPNILKANTPHTLIPSNATITGIEAHIERSGFGGAVIPKDGSVKLEKAGVAVGTNKALPDQWGAEETKTYGHLFDLWGTTWTVAEVKNAKFGVHVTTTISDVFGTLKVDYMDTVVYYSLPDVSIVNKGDTGADPIVEITGAITNPVILNVTTGESLSLTGTIAAESKRVINFRNRTIVDGNGVKKYSELTFPGSEWWKLAPGKNVLRLTGTNASPASGFLLKSQSTWA